MRDLAIKRLSVTPTVHADAIIWDSTLGAWTDIGAHTHIMESSVGDYSYIVKHCQVIYSTIGKFCSIASYVRLNPGNHPIDRPTSHHMTYRAAMFGFAEEDEADFFNWRRDHPVTIGHDVWIGHNTTVMPGVTVGNGAVIGAGAVVTKDVAPYTIVAGVPAKLIRMRFNEDVVGKLTRMQWWDWPREVLEQRFTDFRNLDVFLEKYA
jgi:phosphonate metabolism protein (transferase hexapeptide repeat family)